MGKTGVQIACSLAVCCFNDGSSSLGAISDRLQLSPTALSKSFLKKKYLKRVKGSEYKVSEGAKKLRRMARRRRKGLDDTHRQREGHIYCTVFIVFPKLYTFDTKTCFSLMYYYLLQHIWY